MSLSSNKFIYVGFILKQACQFSVKRPPESPEARGPHSTCDHQRRENHFSWPQRMLKKGSDLPRVLVHVPISGPFINITRDTPFIGPPDYLPSSEWSGPCINDAIWRREVSSGKKVIGRSTTKDKSQCQSFFLPYISLSKICGGNIGNGVRRPEI